MPTPEPPTVTIRDQAGADGLIASALANGPIHLRIEPIERPIDLTNIGEIDGRPLSGLSNHPCVDDEPSDNPGILSVTVSGGEKPVHPSWIRSLRDDCEEAGVPFVFESWGEYLPISQWDGDDFDGEIKTLRHDGAVFESDEPHGLCCTRCTAEDVLRVGRSRSGRTLDGAIHGGGQGG